MSYYFMQVSDGKKEFKLEFDGEKFIQHGDMNFGEAMTLIYKMPENHLCSPLEAVVEFSKRDLTTKYVKMLKDERFGGASNFISLNYKMVDQRSI